MAAKKTIRKQDKSISTFLNEWAQVIQNLPKSIYVINKVEKKEIDIDEVLRRLHAKFNRMEWYNDSQGQAAKSGYESCMEDLEDIIGSMRVD